MQIKQKLMQHQQLPLLRLTSISYQANVALIRLQLLIHLYMLSMMILSQQLVLHTKQQLMQQMVMMEIPLMSGT